MLHLLLPPLPRPALTPLLSTIPQLPPPHGPAHSLLPQSQSSLPLFPLPWIPRFNSNQSRRRCALLSLFHHHNLTALPVVRTKVDEDGKLLPAKSITVSVRCYESRLGRVNAMATRVLVDYTQVLWSKSDEREWDDIGDTEYSFRITVPTKVAGHSTAHFQDYRVWWRVEACMSIRYSI